MSGFILCDENYQEITEIKFVLSAEHSEKLNGENLLRFSLILDKKAQELFTEDKIIKHRDTYFELSVINKKQPDGGLLIVDVECDHITFRLADANYDVEDYEFSGTPQDALINLLSDTPFTAGTVEFVDNVELLKDGTASRRDLLMTLVSILGGEIEYAGMAINIVRQRGNPESHNLTDGQNIKVMEHKVDRRQKDVDGNSRHTFLCSLVKADDIGIGDTVELYYPALNINTTVRIFSIAYNPYNTLDTHFEIGNFEDKLENTFLEMARDISKKNTEIVTTIVDVVENQVLVSDTAQILCCWIDELNVQYLETEFHALDILRPAPLNSERNFIRIFGQEISFINAELSETETENYITRSGHQIYWTSINVEGQSPNPQAYKYFTVTDPITVQPDTKDMTDEEKEEIRELFRVKVRKTLSENIRMSIRFDENHLLKIPKMFWGRGDEAGNGQGIMYKESDGFYFTYTLRKSVGVLRAGDETGIRLTDSGIPEWLDPADGKWKIFGSGGAGIDDAITSADSTWSSKKIDEMIGVPIDIMEAALYGKT